MTGMKIKIEFDIPQKVKSRKVNKFVALVCLEYALAERQSQCKSDKHLAEGTLTGRELAEARRILEEHGFDLLYKP